MCRKIGRGRNGLGQIADRLARLSCPERMICARTYADAQAECAAQNRRSDFLPGRRKRCSTIAGKVERA
jgi:hypothetical protein